MHQLQDGKLDGRAARERFKALWQTIKVDDLPSPKEKHWQWMFPLPGYDAASFGDSYSPDNYRFLDGANAKGFPALRLYLRDRARLGVDERTKRPAPVVSATDGVVVAAEKFCLHPASFGWRTARQVIVNVELVEMVVLVEVRMELARDVQVLQAH